jgi:ferric-dicitrate binding protein FerR (iron transport regulator)
MTTIRPLLLVSMLLAAGPALAADSKAPAARLVHAAGDVTIESKEGGRLGKTGALVGNGDSVATAEGALAVIELPDGSRLKLRESSRVAVAWPGPKSGDLSEAFLSYGSLFAKITKRLAGQRFQVRTPSAVAAVRGTEFFTAYGRAKGKDRDLWVCVNEGSVALTTTKAKKELLVPAGKGVLIKSGLDLTKPQAFEWTKTLNWNMDAAKGEVEDKTNLDGAYSDLLDQDYR